MPKFSPIFPTSGFSRTVFAIAAGVSCLVGALNSSAADLTGTVGIEGRLFVQGERVPAQKDGSFSVFVQPELFTEWADGDQSLLITPFARLDSADPERTHFDLRELVWTVLGNEWELRVGISKVFWGVAESNHLVDIINQTDFVENIDGEDKLGQPMIRFDWVKDWGTVGVFALPYFRERTFPGKTGRPSLIPYVDDHLDEYDATAEKTHVDWAIRYANTFGPVDLGLAHFWGTSREPRYQPVIRHPTDVVLRPYYDVIHQTSVDLQAVVEEWLWKFEALYRSGMGEGYFAAVGGFEYTFYGVTDAGMDVGVVAEFSYDDRPDKLPAIRASDIPGLIANGAQFPAEMPKFALATYDDDLMLGVRLNMNDTASTEALIGTVIDAGDGTMFFSVEAKRRITDKLSLELNGRFFANVDDRNPLWFFERDDYVELNLNYFF